MIRFLKLTMIDFLPRTPTPVVPSVANEKRDTGLQDDVMSCMPIFLGIYSFYRHERDEIDNYGMM
jgi:hypothetical protein